MSYDFTFGPWACNEIKFFSRNSNYLCFICSYMYLSQVHKTHIKSKLVHWKLVPSTPIANKLFHHGFSLLIIVFWSDCRDWRFFLQTFCFFSSGWSSDCLVLLFQAGLSTKQEKKSLIWAIIEKYKQNLILTQKNLWWRFYDLRCVHTKFDFYDLNH